MMNKNPALPLLGMMLASLMGAAAAAEETVPVIWDWNGIIGTGQSLSVGTGPLLSEEQPYHNLQLSRGDANQPPYDAANSQLELVPLVEQQNAFGYPAPYPSNLYGETPHTAMASEISALSLAKPGKDHVTVHTIVGESGQGMVVIRKGAKDTGTTGRAYAASIFEITAITRLAKAAGKTWGVQAITLTHGETDAGNGAYGKEMIKLWNNYNEDIKAITGQTKDVLMLVVQQHSCPSTAGVSPSTINQWKAGLDNPGKIVCIGPNYQRSYGSDGVHLTSEGYRDLGEKYGQIYYQWIVLGNDWQPLQPQKISVSGKTVTVDFHVPTGPLVWDTAMEAPWQAVPEWKNGKGFEVSAPGIKVGIESVAISGNSVIITCDQELPAKGVRIGYAITGDGTRRTDGSFRWGLLRDSDPFAGRSGHAQPNYCVAFEVSLPWPKK